jgi:ketosteroid isomerase-like protein
MITEQQFRENMQRILSALNAKDWGAFDKVVDELFATDYVWHLPGAREPVLNRDGFKQRIWGAVQAWPDFRVEIEDVLVMGDKAAARLAEYRTDPETGQAQRLTSLMIHHTKDGRFAEDWQLISAWEDEA